MTDIEQIRVSILGATGYGGGELIRLLLGFPEFRIVHATSRSQAGVPVSSIHRNLQSYTDLVFSNPTDTQIMESSDVVIGALPHGASAESLAPYIDKGVPVIDLSGDFRLRDADAYRRWYKRDHPRPDLLKKAVYGCPELNSAKIRKAKLVASPGCFATAVNLALFPVARKKIARGTATVVAMTGSSGSGAVAKEGTHHPTRAQTLRPYKVLDHQHTPEILQLCSDAGAPLDGLSFVPVSAPIVRGILAVVSVDLTQKSSTREIEALYTRTYSGKPFVRVLTEREPECATVAGTNYVEVRPRISEDGRLHVVTSVDNLVKGGAGQAVECLCLMHGIDSSAQGSPLAWPGMWP